MPFNRPTPDELFASAGGPLKEMFDFIDSEIDREVPSEDLERILVVKYEYEETVQIALLYMQWRMARKREGVKDAGVSGYDILCEVNGKRGPDDEIDLTGTTQGPVLPDRDRFIHIDVVLPEEGEPDADTHRLPEAILEVAVRTLRGENSCHKEIDSTDCALFAARGRVPIRGIPISNLFGDEYVLEKDEEDSLVVTLNRYGVTLKTITIPIRGPWPWDLTAGDTKSVHMKDCTAEEIMSLLPQFAGWRNLKRELRRTMAFSRVEEKREKAGFKRNIPELHCIIAGNSGTGKTTASEIMAAMYRSLKMLDNSRVAHTRVSRLSSSSINGEYGNTISVIESIQGGALIFEDAHELFRTETKNYDSEQHILRALSDALDDRGKYGNWMLILTGDMEGIESLLAANPDFAKHFKDPIQLEDFTPDELMEITGSFFKARELMLSEDAENKLRMYLQHKCSHREPGAMNTWLITKLLDRRIIPVMRVRLAELENPTPEQLRTVVAEDIPSVSSGTDGGLEALDALVGLEKVKTRLRNYLNAVRLSGRRMELGLPVNMPRLNMVFLGNPGTGKTTVAEIIGKTFASWGILSGGRVIRTEKSQMVGQYIGETEFKMNNLLAKAKGNILFIDEAYQLVEGGEKDYGRIVMNSLLTELGKDSPDMVVILAGYTAPMKKLLESNAGIGSRFPNVINFDDYTTDELMEIARMMIRRQGFILSDGAAARLRTIIGEESGKPSPHFGNGRFVSNLLQNEVLSSLGERTAAIAHPTAEQLSTILPEDVVIDKARRETVFDDKAIDDSLAKLDALVGLDNVKTAIHDFVRSARYLHSIGEPYAGRGLLAWRFIGHSGTGKSTVGGIMAAILRGMRLLSNSNIVEIKGERIFNVSEADCDKVLAEAVKRSCNGLIFIDMDNPQVNWTNPGYGRSIEQVRLKLKELTVESGGECALILAELDSPNRNMAEQLSEAGIHEFDHTLIFKDFSTWELLEILRSCLGGHGISLTPATEKALLNYLGSLPASAEANARTMKLMSRAICQRVILRESALDTPPETRHVQLQDIAMFKWNPKKGKIGF